MAARGNNFCGSVKESDFLYDISCAPCENDGENVEAVKYCADCDENLCAACLISHNKFALMRGHKVLDQAQINQGQTKQLPSQRCSKYGGKMINVFCPKHDTVGCPTCISVDHSSCHGKKDRMDGKRMIASIHEVEYKEDINIQDNVDKETVDLRNKLSEVQNELQKATERRDTAIALDMSSCRECKRHMQLATETQAKYERELKLHAGDVEAHRAVKKQLEGLKFQQKVKEEEVNLAQQKMTAFTIKQEPGLDDVNEEIQSVESAAVTTTKTEPMDSLDDIKPSPMETSQSRTPVQSPAPSKARKLFKPDELRQAFMPTLKKRYREDPDSLPFRQPVDPAGLQTPDVLASLSNNQQAKKIKLEGTMDVSTQPNTLTEIKQEPGLADVEQEIPSVDSAAVATPKTEPTDSQDDIKPSLMETSQSSTPVQSPAPSKPKASKIYKPDELRQALLPTLEKLNRQDPESLAFRQPVDPVVLQIPQQVPQTQPVPHTGAPGGVIAGVPGIPGPPGESATAQPQSADPEKRKLTQQQLVLLLHAHKCQRRGQNNGEACTLPHCRTMKNVLNHITTCNAGKSCLVAHCASSRQIITHWKNCTHQDCPVCLPLKHASDRQKQPGGKLNMAFPAEAGPQPTNTAAPAAAGPPSTINTTGPAVPPGMNDAQLQKAYAALGLPYNGNNTSSLGANNPNRSQVNSQGPGAGGQNAVNQLLGNQNNPMKALIGTGGGLPNNDLQIIAQTTRGTKEWHQSVTQDLRNHLVYKLVQAIFPTQNPADLKDRRMNNLVSYARKVEGDMYEIANSREEYDHFLAEKICKIQKELEDKLEDKRRQRREFHEKHPADPTAPGIQPPSIFKPDELRQALMPTLEKLYRQDPESLPFRQPVDPVVLQIPDYFEIVRKPMDLSTIKRKLDTGQYKDPWEYVDDVWLMFDNAWVYNKKSSRVYKYCTKLSEVFEQEINSVMLSLGYCCGIKQSFRPQVLCCNGKQLCTIPREAVYYSYQNRSSTLLSDRYTYCEKCFLEIQGDDLELMDDPSQPTLKVRKHEFHKLKNDGQEMEPFVDCDDCGRKLHRICVLHFEPIWNNGFTCENCLNAKGAKRKDNKYCAKRLPGSKLGNYLEKRINTFLKKEDAGAGEVSIKVLSSSDKLVEVRPGMKTKFVDNGEFPEQFQYKAKSMLVFEDIDGTDVCFFGMHVQEYGSECQYPNNRRVYISLLDYVHFFQPRQLHTAVYHEILIGYLEYVKSLGYVWAHIWACPPCDGDDYIFHCHPSEQKVPKPKFLQEWYKNMLNKAKMEQIVIDYKDIYKDSIENNVTMVTDLPYFEGDFWPHVLENVIKEQEEEVKRVTKEAEDSAEPDDTEGPCSVDGVGKKKDKSQNKKKNNKNNKNNRKANCKKLNLPHGGNDLTAKLYSTMVKHKEVFFVIRLHTQQAAFNLPPILDPDPHMSCELMDGRDALLTFARGNHYEFSSLRRAKYSSIALLYELHNQGKESFVYTCNTCEAQVETRWHCTVCTDFDRCNTCYQKDGHHHKMDRLGFDLDDGSSSGDKQDPQENRRQSIQRCIQSLVHACGCRDANCRLPSCHKMKRVVAHAKQCRKKTNSGCPICKQLIALCCYHAKHCSEQKCQVPFCLQIKHKLRQQ